MRSSLWLGWSVILFIIVLLLGGGLGGSSSLGSWGGLWLLLLLGWGELGILLQELDTTKDLADLSLVGDGLEVSSEVSVLASDLLTNDELVGELQVGSEGQVSQGDSVTNDEGVLLEVVVEGSEALVELLPGLLFEGLGVVPHSPCEVEQDQDGSVDLFVGKADPLLDLSSSGVVRSQEVGIVGDSSD